MEIFEYQDYKKYVLNRLAAAPDGGRGQFQKLAKALSVHASLISHVLRLDGQFSQDHALLVAEYLGLNDLETEYLIDLVHYARANERRLKNVYLRRLQAHRETNATTEKKMGVTSESQSIFYSEWYYTAVRLLTSIENYKTLEAISEYLALPNSFTKQILDFLVDTGLCVLKNGKYSTGPKKTLLEKSSPLSIRHRANWRLKTVQSLPRIKNNEVCLTSTMTIAVSDFEQILATLRDGISRVHDIADQSKPEMLVCMNVDCFEVTK